MKVFWVGYIFWTMTFGIYGVLCLGMGWGSPWVSVMCGAMQWSMFCYALRGYHCYRSNVKAEGL